MKLGQVLYRRGTERDATGVHAGGTPALPGGRLWVIEVREIGEVVPGAVSQGN